MLYIVPTPIGNLEDFTYRATRILREVDLILAEDTRTTGVLLKKYEIDTPMRSFHNRNEHRILPELLQELKVKDLALVSDAGTPGISDPGFLLARACRENDLDFTCLPGATALIPALLMSGLPCDKFHFEGFLPHRKGRNTRLEYLSTLEVTFIVLVSPHRVIKAVEQLAEICGSERKAALVKEISKIHETVYGKTLREISLDINQIDGRIKGEYVLVVQGK